MKKMTLSKIKQKYWEKISLKVKQSYADENGNCKCFTCGSDLKIGTSNCQAGHCYPQGAYPSLRWNLDNIRPQCYNCNVIHHGRIHEFKEKLIEEIGVERVNELHNNRHNQLKLSVKDYERMINEL